MVDRRDTRFLIDEDVPRSTATALREAGFDAIDVRDIGLRGKQDQIIYDYAQREARVLVTCDLGFASTISFPPQEHHGVIVIRITDAVSIPVFNREVCSAILKISDELFHHLVIIEIGRVRLRS
jgi:predicted nuclease of predicted toxin-antitoxin system